MPSLCSDAEKPSSSSSSSSLKHQRFTVIATVLLFLSVQKDNASLIKHYSSTIMLPINHQLTVNNTLNCNTDLNYYASMTSPQHSL
jgi:hypothetical protein